jgi:hypothetical protein
LMLFICLFTFGPILISFVKDCVCFKKIKHDFHSIRDEEICFNCGWNVERARRLSRYEVNLIKVSGVMED